MKVMYALKALSVVYLAIVIELIKTNANKALTGVISLLIISIAFDRLILFFVVVGIPLTILFIIAIIVYTQATKDPSDKIKFDAAIQKVLDSLSELAYIN